MYILWSQKVIGHNGYNYKNNKIAFNLLIFLEKIIDICTKGYRKIIFLAFSKTNLKAIEQPEHCLIRELSIPHLVT